MRDLILVLDKDIERCEYLIKQNNQLEIVIGIEELVDKYKDSIDGIEIENDNVWNYGRKDLINIKQKLNLHKTEIAYKHRQHKISDMFDNAIEDVKASDEVPLDKISECLNVINDIKSINDESLSINEKWSKLRKHINWTSKADVSIGAIVIPLINSMLDIDDK